MTPEQFLLASAYLDGELTDDERRLAEADPAVMAEVEELRALHVELGDVEPPSAGARESAIAAAMAAFSPVAASPVAEVAAADAAPSTRNVVPFRPRPSYTKYLSIAAAVVGVGVLGTVLITAGRGGDDDFSAADMPASTESAASSDRIMEAMPADQAADAPAEEPVADAAGTAAAESELPMDIAEAPPTTDAPADEPASGEDVGNVQDPSLPSQEVLIDHALSLLEMRDAGTLGATPETRCVVDSPVEVPILDREELPTELGTLDLLIAIDEQNRIIYGLDPVTCAALVGAPLP